MGKKLVWNDAVKEESKNEFPNPGKPVLFWECGSISLHGVVLSGEALQFKISSATAAFQWIQDKTFRLQVIHFGSGKHQACLLHSYPVEFLRENLVTRKLLQLKWFVCFWVLKLVCARRVRMSCPFLLWLPSGRNKNYPVLRALCLHLHFQRLCCCCREQNGARSALQPRTADLMTLLKLALPSYSVSLIFLLDLCSSTRICAS